MVSDTPNFEFPEDQVAALLAGFEGLSGLSPAVVEQVVDHVVVLLDPAEIPPDPNGLARRCEVDTLTANQIVAATMFLASALFLTKPPMAISRFIDAARNSKILGSADPSRIESVATDQLGPRQKQLGEINARVDSLFGVLPAFGSLNATINVRLGRSTGRFVATPVAIVKLVAESSELVFQMTRRDVESLRGHLEAIASGLTAAGSFSDESGA